MYVSLSLSIYIYIHLSLSLCIYVYKLILMILLLLLLIIMIIIHIHIYIYIHIRTYIQQPNTYPHPRIPATRLFFVIPCFSPFSSTWGNPEVGGGDNFLDSYIRYVMSLLPRLSSAITAHFYFGANVVFRVLFCRLSFLLRQLLSKECI